MNTTSGLPLSIQLYSLRSELGNRFKQTLQGLAEIGFQAVEFAGMYGGMPPRELADFLKQTGLRASGMHAMPNGAQQLADPDSEFYRYARALDCEFISLSSNINPETFSEQMHLISELQRVAAGQGRVLTYHNHAREFDRLPDGRIILDAMRDTTAAANLQFQFDVFFAFHRGYDPCAGLENFRGRAPQIHFNDLDPEGKSACDAAKDCMKLSTELGAGIMDLQAIYRKAVATGVRLVVLEQHSTRLHPLESARINFAHYRTLI